jgi:hypothetical protein
MAENESTQQTSEMSAAAEYAKLGETEATPNSSEFCQAQIEKYADNPDLVAILERHAAATAQYDLALGRDGIDQSRVADELTHGIRSIDSYMREPRETGSSTLVDMELGKDQDEIVADHLMELLGASGRAITDEEPDAKQPDRYSTTYYATDLPGFALKRWRHRPDGQPLQGYGNGDKEKFSLIRSSYIQ